MDSETYVSYQKSLNDLSLPHEVEGEKIVHVTRMAPNTITRFFSYESISLDNCWYVMTVEPHNPLSKYRVYRMWAVCTEYGPEWSHEHIRTFDSWFMGMSFVLGMFAGSIPDHGNAGD